MFVYVIRSEKDGRFYVGMSADVEKRLNEHNSGKTRSTKAYRPWKFFRSEERRAGKEGRKRGKYLKSGIGKKWIKDKYNRSYSSVGYLPALPAGRQGALEVHNL